MTDDTWKRQVCERAREVIDRALAGMHAYAAESPTSGAARIRPAEPTDHETIFAFNVAMARETEDLVLDPETLRAGVEALLADSTRGRVFVVEERGEIVASLMLTLEWSDWRNGNFWWIQSVYVSPPHRRRGHYRRLHDHVRQLAASDHGVCGLRLYVERENDAAQSTYRTLGMHETHYRVYEQSTRNR
jgi:ribosomal protein S18 acetylase RimI-like enzyme